MKKFFSLMLILCLCLSLSTSFTFAADQAVSDSTTHTRLQTIINWLQNYAPTYNQMSTIAGSLSTIVGWNNSNGILTNINHNLLVIAGFLDPANGSSTSAILNNILEALIHTNAAGTAISWLQDINASNTSQATSLTNLYNLDNSIGTEPFNGSSQRITLPVINSQGNLQTFQLATGGQNWRQNFFVWLKYLNDTVAYSSNFLLNGFNTAQSYVDWTDITTAGSFTPTSQTNGLYTWLSLIQAPAARLSYVLASDERIAAQEASAANEDAVVDNFIDSSGSGAASPSDISSVSGLSSGFKDNISTDASVSGIWNIFNSDNFGWFSQETVDQLDTNGSGNRSLRNYGSYSTPLLDQQIEDILKYIGGDEND